MLRLQAQIFVDFFLKQTLDEEEIYFLVNLSPRLAAAQVKISLYVLLYKSVMCLQTARKLEIRKWFPTRIKVT